MDTARHMPESRLRESLFDEVASTIEPVAPLARPEAQAWPLLGLGIVLLAAVPLLWEVRGDAATLGLVRLWGLSLVQTIAATAILAMALAEGVPGRLTSPAHLAMRVALALAVTGAAIGVIYVGSPVSIPTGLAQRYFAYCATHVFALGLLPAISTLAMLRRGLTARPAVAGALAGLGGGLMSDAAWRVFCHMSTPIHVVPAHLTAVAALAACGALAGALLRRPA